MTDSSTNSKGIRKLWRRLFAILGAILFSWWFVVDVIVELSTIDESEIDEDDDVVAAINNRYWERTVRVAAHTALLIAIIGILDEFSSSLGVVIESVPMILILLSMFWGSEAIARDKKALSKELEGINTRWIITVLLLVIISGCMYFYYYALMRGRNPAKKKSIRSNSTKKSSSAEIVLQSDNKKESSSTNQSTQKQNIMDQHSDLDFFDQPPDQDFTDIAGMNNFKTEIREKVIKPFRGGRAYTELDVNMENGILLYGPPGTGKTHVSNCLAGELGVKFASINTNDITSEYLGMGVKTVKRLFAEARANQPALIFLDELDAIATDRSNQSQHHDRKQIVSQLLQELSDLEDDDIVVIGATNNLDSVDDAILRTGRFDSKIKVEKPNVQTRAEIFTYHLSTAFESVDYNRFEKTTRNLTASDMATAAETAARYAARRAERTGQSAAILTQDIFEAIEDVSLNQRQLGDYVTRPPSKDFDDAAGMESLKTRLHEIVIDPLENQREYEKFGISVETGILLYGPPGTGKTHITQCLAGELGINYVECSASDLTSKFVGEAAKNVDQLFSEAVQHSPCLIFLDEFDALASSRTGRGQTKSQRQLVNQFLQELSALQDSDDTVIVITATNRPSDIDPAMLRTGRLSEKIEVPSPDGETRIRILQAHLEAPTTNLNFKSIRNLTSGFVASDMAQIATEAARNAVRRSEEPDSKKRVTQQDIETAIENVRNETTNGTSATIDDSVATIIRK